MNKIALSSLVVVAALTIAPWAQAQPSWDKVAAALGKSGAEMAGGVYRVGLPRSDLHVTVDGVEIKPALALGGWLAFKVTGEASMVMGDLVMAENEINPVMAKLFSSGIQVSALHNHLLRAQPATFYMHVAGEGDAVKLATALHEALGASKTPFGPAPGGATAAAPLDLDSARLEQVLGHKGNATGGVYQFSIPRADVINEAGMPVPPAMGTGIAINFQPTGGGKAAITGDFVLQGAELNPVLQTLRDNGIEVTAVHNHMVDEQPRTFFVHFWANDDAAKLAQGLRAALDKVNVAKS